MVSDMEELLKKEGWYVSMSRVEELNEEGGGSSNNNVDSLIKMLLDLDLNSIGFQNKTENGNVARPKAETLCGPLVLQIQRVRNVSAPKANETSHTAPQLLKVTVTDGSSIYQILQMGKWNTVTLDTPPGTKVQLKPGNTCKVVCGFVPLKQNQFSLIGGGVQSLIEKWQLTKAYGMNSRQRESRAPKWVPFGQALINDTTDTKGGFKSLDTDAKQVKENEAFDQQRQANIEEIAKAFDGKKKSFMKSKPPVASAPMERHRGDQRHFDQRSSSSSGVGRPGRHEPPTEPNRGRPERKPHSRREEREDMPNLTAPSKPSTLFDFLTNKLGDGEGTKDPVLNAVAKQSSQFDNSQQEQQASGRSKGGDWGREERPGKRGNPPSTYPPPSSGGRPRSDSDNNYRNNHHQQQQQQYSSYKSAEGRPQHKFQNGDKVLAKYWEDQKLHRAVIAAMGEAGRTCVIQFVDYDNYEEVLLTDVQPCSPQKWDNFRTGAQQQQQQQQQRTSGNPQNPRYHQSGGFQDPNRSGGEGGSNYRGRGDSNFRQDEARPPRNDRGPPRGGQQHHHNQQQQHQYHHNNQEQQQYHHNQQQQYQHQQNQYHHNQPQQYQQQQYQQSEARAFDEGGNLNHNFSGTFEFRRGGGRPYVKQDNGRPGGDRGGHRGTSSRPERQFYQPPRQRRE